MERWSNTSAVAARRDGDGVTVGDVVAVKIEGGVLLDGWGAATVSPVGVAGDGTSQHSARRRGRLPPPHDDVHGAMPAPLVPFAGTSTRLAAAASSSQRDAAATGTARALAAAHGRDTVVEEASLLAAALALRAVGVDPPPPSDLATSLRLDAGGSDHGIPSALSTVAASLMPISATATHLLAARQHHSPPLAPAPPGGRGVGRDGGHMQLHFVPRTRHVVEGGTWESTPPAMSHHAVAVPAKGTPLVGISRPPRHASAGPTPQPTGPTSAPPSARSASPSLHSTPAVPPSVLPQSRGGAPASAPSPPSILTTTSHRTSPAPPVLRGAAMAATPGNGLQRAGGAAAMLNATTRSGVTARAPVEAARAAVAAKAEEEARAAEQARKQEVQAFLARQRAAWAARDREAVHLRKSGSEKRRAALKAMHEEERRRARAFAAAHMHADSAMDGGASAAREMERVSRGMDDTSITATLTSTLVAPRRDPAERAGNAAVAAAPSSHGRGDEVPDGMSVGTATSHRRRWTPPPWVPIISTPMDDIYAMQAVCPGPSTGEGEAAVPARPAPKPIAGPSPRAADNAIAPPSPSTTTTTATTGNDHTTSLTSTCPLPSMDLTRVSGVVMAGSNADGVITNRTPLSPISPRAVSPPPSRTTARAAWRGDASLGLADVPPVAASHPLLTTTSLPTSHVSVVPDVTRTPSEPPRSGVGGHDTGAGGSGLMERVDQDLQRAAELDAHLRLLRRRLHTMSHPGELEGSDASSETSQSTHRRQRHSHGASSVTGGGTIVASSARSSGDGEGEAPSTGRSLPSSLASPSWEEAVHHATSPSTTPLQPRMGGDGGGRAVDIPNSSATEAGQNEPATVRSLVVEREEVPGYVQPAAAAAAMPPGMAAASQPNSPGPVTTAPPSPPSPPSPTPMAAMRAFLDGMKLEAEAPLPPSASSTAAHVPIAASLSMTPHTTPDRTPPRREAPLTPPSPLSFSNADDSFQHGTVFRVQAALQSLVTAQQAAASHRLTTSHGPAVPSFVVPAVSPPRVTPPAPATSNLANLPLALASAVAPHAAALVGVHSSKEALKESMKRSLIASLRHPSPVSRTGQHNASHASLDMPPAPISAAVVSLPAPPPPAPAARLVARMHDNHSVLDRIAARMAAVSTAATSSSAAPPPGGGSEVADVPGVTPMASASQAVAPIPTAVADGSSCMTEDTLVESVHVQPAPTLPAAASEVSSAGGSGAPALTHASAMRAVEVVAHAEVPSMPAQPVPMAMAASASPAGGGDGALALSPPRASPDELYRQFLSSLDAWTAADTADAAVAAVQAARAETFAQQAAVLAAHQWQQEREAMAMAAQLTALAEETRHSMDTRAAEFTAQLERIHAARQAAHAEAAAALAAELAAAQHITTSTQTEVTDAATGGTVTSGSTTIPVPHRMDVTATAQGLVLPWHVFLPHNAAPPLPLPPADTSPHPPTPPASLLALPPTEPATTSRIEPSPVDRHEVAVQTEAVGMVRGGGPHAMSPRRGHGPALSPIAHHRSSMGQGEGSTMYTDDFEGLDVSKGDGGDGDLPPTQAPGRPATHSVLSDASMSVEDVVSRGDGSVGSVVSDHVPVPFSPAHSVSAHRSHAWGGHAGEMSVAEQIAESLVAGGTRDRPDRAMHGDDTSMGVEEGGSLVLHVSDASHALPAEVMESGGGVESLVVAPNRAGSVAGVVEEEEGSYGHDGFESMAETTMGPRPPAPPPASPSGTADRARDTAIDGVQGEEGSFSTHSSLWDGGVSGGGREESGSGLKPLMSTFVRDLRERLRREEALLHTRTTAVKQATSLHLARLKREGASEADRHATVMRYKAHMAELDTEHARVKAQYYREMLQFKQQVEAMDQVNTHTLPSPARGPSADAIADSGWQELEEELVGVGGPSGTRAADAVATARPLPLASGVSEAMHEMVAMMVAAMRAAVQQQAPAAATGARDMQAAAPSAGMMEDASQVAPLVATWTPAIPVPATTAAMDTSFMGGYEEDSFEAEASGTEVPPLATAASPLQAAPMDVSAPGEVEVEVEEEASLGMADDRDDVGVQVAPSTADTAPSQPATPSGGDGVIQPMVAPVADTVPLPPLDASVAAGSTYDDSFDAEEASAGANIHVGREEGPTEMAPATTVASTPPAATHWWKSATITLSPLPVDTMDAVIDLGGRGEALAVPSSTSLHPPASPTPSWFTHVVDAPGPLPHSPVMDAIVTVAASSHVAAAAPAVAPRGPTVVTAEGVVVTDGEQLTDLVTDALFQSLTAEAGGWLDAAKVPSHALSVRVGRGARRRGGGASGGGGVSGDEDHLSQTADSVSSDGSYGDTGSMDSGSRSFNKSRESLGLASSAEPVKATMHWSSTSPMAASSPAVPGLDLPSPSHSTSAGTAPFSSPAPSPAHAATIPSLATHTLAPSSGSTASPSKLSPRSPGQYGRDDVFLAPSPHRNGGAGITAGVVGGGSAKSPLSTTSQDGDGEEEVEGLYDFQGAKQTLVVPLALASASSGVPATAGSGDAGAGSMAMVATTPAHAHGVMGSAGQARPSHAASTDAVAAGHASREDAIAAARAAALAKAHAQAQPPPPSPAQSWEQTAMQWLHIVHAVHGQQYWLDAVFGSATPLARDAVFTPAVARALDADWTTGAMLPPRHRRAMAMMLLDLVNDELARFQRHHWTTIAHLHHMTVRSAAVGVGGTGTTAALTAGREHLANKLDAAIRARLAAASKHSDLGAFPLQGHAAEQRADAIARLDVRHSKWATFEDAAVDEQAVVAAVARELMKEVVMDAVHGLRGVRG